nr:hypothetical protein [Tanacetum cinerariifolium]
MKRHGKDFSGKVTPLFETMMAQPQEDMGKDSEIPTDSHHTPTVTQPSTSSQPQQKHKFKKSKKRIIEVPQLSDSTYDVADEHVITTSNDPLLSGEDRLKLTELMELCTQLQSRGRMIDDLDADKGFALVDETQGRNDQDMFDTSILDDEEVVAEKEVSTADPVPTAEERLVRQKKEEANIALIESQDNTQAMTDANYELAVRLQEEKKGELTIEEKSRLFVELIDKRKKYFARCWVKFVINPYNLSTASFWS